MELSRLLLLALLGLTTGYVSRPGLAMRPAMRPAATLRPAAPMNPALTRMMAEETAEDAVELSFNEPLTGQHTALWIPTKLLNTK